MKMIVSNVNNSVIFIISLLLYLYYFQYCGNNSSILSHVHRPNEKAVALPAATLKRKASKKNISVLSYVPINQPPWNHLHPTEFFTSPFGTFRI